MKKIIILLILVLLFLCGCDNSSLFDVTIYYDNKTQIIKLEKNSLIDLNKISILDTDSIEGLFYDENFVNKYNNEILDKPVILYIKVKTVVISFVYKNDQINLNFNYNEVLQRELLENKLPFEYEDIYYDEEYKSIYDGEKLTKSTTLYLKPKKESFSYCDNIRFYNGKDLSKQEFYPILKSYNEYISYIENNNLYKEFKDESTVDEIDEQFFDNNCLLLIPVYGYDYYAMKIKSIVKNGEMLYLDLIIYYPENIPMNYQDRITRFYGVEIEKEFVSGINNYKIQNISFIEVVNE